MIIAMMQARLGSMRLPRKILLGLEGKPVLEHIINRVRNSKMINDIVVVTTSNENDIEIVRLCEVLGVKVCRGSEQDVLDRYYQAAEKFKADHIVRITSDCPLIDPCIIDEVVNLHMAEKADYTSNVIKATFPDGEDVEVFTFKALEKTWKEARLLSEREHVTPYMYKKTGIFKLKNLNCARDLSAKRWTLDNPEDYEFIRLIYRGLYKKNRIFGMEEILRFIDLNPGIEMINHHIKRNEGYTKSLLEDKFIK